MLPLGSPEAFAPGHRVGPFVLLAPMGTGGSGRVWAVARVGQLGFTKRMALKVMRRDKLQSLRARQRFERDARLAATLRHPHVREVHELGELQGRPYMAMRWVDTSLSELLQHAPGHRVDWEIACWLSLQCCAGLSAAHENADPRGSPSPIVHGDVSPGNLLLTTDGHVLLSDLGAAIERREASRSRRSAPAGHFFGSLGYAAPEALREQALDARADLFSLGAVLYEALVGEPAFEADSEASLLYQILEGPSPEIRESSIPQAVRAVVQRALRREVDERFESARAMGAALAACLAEHSAFALERRTADAIEEALGARLRRRERYLHESFQRHAPASGFTETLPVRPALGSATPLLSSTEAASSWPPVAAKRTLVRRSSVPAFLLLLVLATMVVTLGPLGSRRDDGASRSEAAPGELAPPPARPARASGRGRGAPRTDRRRQAQAHPDAGALVERGSRPGGTPAPSGPAAGGPPTRGEPSAHPRSGPAPSAPPPVEGGSSGAGSAAAREGAGSRSEKETGRVAETGAAKPSGTRKRVPNKRVPQKRAPRKRAPQKAARAGSSPQPTEPVEDVFDFDFDEANPYGGAPAVEPGRAPGTGEPGEPAPRGPPRAG